MKFHSLLLPLILPLLLASTSAIAELEPGAPSPNNFANVETWDYPSGLRVHFKSMPRVSNIYITAVLPVGSANDPRGREGLAHFVEHMLFTDHRGKTEEEIKQSVLDRGGRKNATTSRYRTRYYLDLPAAEWSFGLEWMHHLLRGHRFTAGVVDAERQVVMLEKSRRYPASTEPLDRIQQWLWGRGLLVKQDFWQREFGLERDYRSVIGSYASLRAINVADLQDFYERYYGPQNITLVIAGNAPREAVKRQVDQSFGYWPASGERVSTLQPLMESSGPVQRVDFARVRNVDHKLSYKLFSVSDYDLEMAYFSARFLRHLLNQRLRMEDKDTYAVSVKVAAYAGHGILSISGNYGRYEADKVERVIRGLLEELKAGELPPALFDSVRARAVSDLSMGYQSAASIAGWCTVDALCNKDIYSGFPDKIAHWKGLDQRELSAWMRRVIKPSNEVLEITRPVPAGFWWLEWVGPFLAVVLVFHALRARWARPLAMGEIRYLCKIRYPLGLVLCWLSAAAILIFLLLLPAYKVYEPLAFAVAAVDAYLVQRGVQLALLAGGAALLLTLSAMVPRKVLLFNSEWRIKFWSFRSLAYDYRAVREIRECSFFSLLFSRRALTTVFLHWGFFGKGVYVRVGDRLGYFLRVRNNRELVEQLRTRGAPAADSLEALPSPVGGSNLNEARPYANHL